MAEITEKDIKHAIRTCHWRIAVTGQRDLHLCGGACNICEKLIKDRKCDTLQRLFGGKIPPMPPIKDGKSE